jgi:branched-chain amino acid transport system ATP-binding protein
MGITTLLVEQDISYAFDLAVRNYIMSKGKVVAEGTAIDLLKDELVRKSYLGF